MSRSSSSLSHPHPRHSGSAFLATEITLTVPEEDDDAHNNYLRNNINNNNSANYHTPASPNPEVPLGGSDGLQGRRKFSVSEGGSAETNTTGDGGGYASRSYSMDIPQKHGNINVANNNTTGLGAYGNISNNNIHHRPISAGLTDQGAPPSSLSHRTYSNTSNTSAAPVVSDVVATLHPNHHGSGSGNITINPLQHQNSGNQQDVPFGHYGGVLSAMSSGSEFSETVGPNNITTPNQQQQQPVAPRARHRLSATAFNFSSRRSSGESRGGGLSPPPPNNIDSTNNNLLNNSASNLLNNSSGGYSPVQSGTQSPLVPTGGVASRRRRSASNSPQASSIPLLVKPHRSAGGGGGDGNNSPASVSPRAGVAPARFGMAVSEVLRHQTHQAVSAGNTPTSDRGLSPLTSPSPNVVGDQSGSANVSGVFNAPTLKLEGAGGGREEEMSPYSTRSRIAASKNATAAALASATSGIMGGVLGGGGGTSGSGNPANNVNTTASASWNQSASLHPTLTLTADNIAGGGGGGSRAVSPNMSAMGHLNASNQYSPFLPVQRVPSILSSSFRSNPPSMNAPLGMSSPTTGSTPHTATNTPSATGAVGGGWASSKNIANSPSTNSFVDNVRKSIMLKRANSNPNMQKSLLGMSAASQLLNPSPASPRMGGSGGGSFAASSNSLHHHHNQDNTNSTPLIEKRHSSAGLKSRYIEAFGDTEIMRMHTIFEKYTKISGEKEGSVPDKYLIPMLKAMGYTIDPSHAHDLFALIDVNGNGMLEFEELVQLTIIFKATAQFRLFDQRPGVSSKSTAHIAMAVDSFSKILPDKPWRWYWDTLLLFIIVYIVLSVVSLHVPVTSEEYYDTFEIGPYKGVGIVDALVTIPLAVEMYFRFQMSFHNGRGWETDGWEIAKNYLSGWFWMDFLSLIPLRLLVPNSWVASIAVGHFRLLKLLTIKRLFHTSGRVGITADFINYHFLALPIIQLSLSFIATVYVAAVIWYRVYGSVVSLSTCIYVSMYYLTGVGYGDINEGDQDLSQLSYAVFMCALSLLINGILVGNVVTLMGQADVEGLRRTRLVETKAVLDFFNVPTSLQEEILQFQNHVFTKDVHKAYVSLIDHLPHEIKGHMSLQARLSLIKGIPVISASHEIVQIVLAQQLFAAVFCPEEYIAVAGEVTEDIFFINYGFVDQISVMGLYLQTLRAGDVVGAGLIFSKPGEGFHQDVTAKCLTYVEVFVLSSEVLLNALQTFPIFAVQVQKSSPHPLELVAEDGTIIGSTEESQAAKELRQFELLRSGRNAAQAHSKSTFLTEDERPGASSPTQQKPNFNVLSDDTRKDIDAFMFAVSDGDSDEDDDDHDRDENHHHRDRKHRNNNQRGEKAKSSIPVTEDRSTTSPGIDFGGGGASDIVQPNSLPITSQPTNKNSKENNRVVDVSDLLSRQQSTNTPKTITNSFCAKNDNRNDSMANFAPQTPQVVIGASRKLRKTDSGAAGSMMMGRPLSPSRSDTVDQGVLQGSGHHASTTAASSPSGSRAKPSNLNANLLSQPAHHHATGGGSNTTMSLLSPNTTLRRDGSSLLASDSSHVVGSRSGGLRGPTTTFPNQGGPFLNPLSAANNSVVASRAASNLKLRDSEVIVTEEQPSASQVVRRGDDRRGCTGGENTSSARGSRRESAVTLMESASPARHASIVRRCNSSQSGGGVIIPGSRHNSLAAAAAEADGVRGIMAQGGVGGGGPAQQQQSSVRFGELGTLLNTSKTSPTGVASVVFGPSSFDVFSTTSFSHLALPPHLIGKSHTAAGLLNDLRTYDSELITEIAELEAKLASTS